MKIKTNEINNTSFRFHYKTLVVKVKIVIIEQCECVISVGLNNPDNKYNYENWFSKSGSLKNNEYVFGSEFIEHPPFRYYSKFLLTENSLNDFFESIKDNITNNNIVEEDIKAPVSRQKGCERLYSECFVALGKNRSLSEETKRTIKARYNREVAKRIIDKCVKSNLTVRFTDDVNRARRLRVN